METRDLIKYAAIIGGGYVLYQYLQSSGMWAQWFGGASAFTDPAALLSYCHANPSGNASYSMNGVVKTAPCSQWIAAQPATTMPTNTVADNTPSQPTHIQQAVAAMKQSAGNNSQNLDGWAYYWQNGAPFAGAPNGFGVGGSISSMQMESIIAKAGGNRNSLVTADQFVGWLNQTAPIAMSTGGSGAGMQGFQDNPAYVM